MVSQAPLADDPQAGGVRGASRAVGQAVVPGGRGLRSRPPPAGRPPCAGSRAATRSRRARRGAPARRARPTCGSANRATIWRASTPEPRGRRRPGVRHAPRRCRPARSSGRRRSGRASRARCWPPTRRARRRGPASGRRSTGAPGSRRAVRPGSSWARSCAAGLCGRWLTRGVRLTASRWLPAVGVGTRPTGRLRVLALLRSGRGGGVVGASAAAGHEDGGEERRKQDPRHT